MPELDEWTYDSIKPRDGHSYVCSSYVMAILKAAGVFGDMEIQANECTPQDLIELDIFDNKWFSQDINCLTDNPDQPFCQFMGKYRLVLQRFGIRTPYPHMNERCPKIPPHFERPEGC
jgi:hypothetical protein